ncbi:Megf9, partial [Symbiodinium microadriaticum]
MSGCIECDYGHYASEHAATICLPCPAGNYSDMMSSPFCKTCEPGTYSDVQGSWYCEECAIGHWTNTSGSTKCSRCKPGRYAGERGYPTCDRCDPGTYSSDFASVECTFCETGFYAPNMSMTQCEQCYSFLLPLTSTIYLTSCEIDVEAIVAMLFMLLAVTKLWMLLPYIFRFRVAVDDVYVEQAAGHKRVLIRTRGHHWLSGPSLPRCGRRTRKVANLQRIPSTTTAASGKSQGSITIENAQHVSVSRNAKVPVQFRNTHHPFLGTSNSSQESWSMNSAAALAAQLATNLVEQVVSPFHAHDAAAAKNMVQPLTNRHLLLLTAKGVPEERVIETSRGNLSVPFPVTLIRVAPLRVPLLGWLVLDLVIFTSTASLLEARFVVGCTCASLVLALILAALAWNFTPLTLREYKLKEHQRELKKANPDPKPCPRGPGRAIRAGQLWKFYSTFEPLIRQHRKMYYVVSNLVMPLTRSRRLSYAELAGPNKVNWFISHFWGTSFRHFVFSIRKHAESVAVVNNYIGNWADRTYWICSLSNNQWNVAEEVGQSWEESSFYLTLTCGYCAGTAMILDDEAMPLTRAWCLFEVLQTKEIGDRQNSFEGLWLCTATGVLHKGKAGVDVAMRIAERLSTLKLEDATASVQKDKDMIDDLVSQMPGGFNAMNAFVKQNIAEALLRMQEAFSS